MDGLSSCFFSSSVYWRSCWFFREDLQGCWQLQGVSGINVSRSALCNRFSHHGRHNMCTRLMTNLPRVSNIQILIKGRKNMYYMHDMLISTWVSDNCKIYGRLSSLGHRRKLQFGDAIFGENQYAQYSIERFVLPAKCPSRGKEVYAPLGPQILSIGGK